MFVVRWFYRKVVYLNAKWLVVGLVLLILFSSFFISWLEPDKFPSMFDGFWWTMTTLSTTGYGDYYPVTYMGRIWAILLYCVGIGAFTVTIGKVFEFVNESKKKRAEGRVDYKGKNHVVVIGWSGKAEVTVKKILEDELKTDVVLIDEKLEEIPLNKDRFFFIKGVPSREKVLKSASVSEAKLILIFSEAKLKIDSPFDADARTAFIAMSINRLAKGVPTRAEVTLKENIDNLVHAHPNIEFHVSDEAFAREMFPKKETSQG